MTSEWNQSLSLPLPAGPLSSSVTTRSLPAAITYSARLSFCRSSMSRGSQISIGFCFCLFRILPPRQSHCPSTRKQGKTWDRHRHPPAGPRPQAPLPCRFWPAPPPCAAACRPRVCWAGRRRGPPGPGARQPPRLLPVSLGWLCWGEGEFVQAPYWAARCSAVFPSASVEELRNLGSLCLASTSSSRPELLRRAASSSSSVGVAPCTATVSFGRSAGQSDYLVLGVGGVGHLFRTVLGFGGGTEGGGGE